MALVVLLLLVVIAVLWVSEPSMVASSTVRGPQRGADQHSGAPRMAVPRALEAEASALRGDGAPAPEVKTAFDAQRAPGSTPAASEASSGRRFLVQVVDGLGCAVAGAQLEWSDASGGDAELLAALLAIRNRQPTGAAPDTVLHTLVTDVEGRCAVTAPGDVLLYASKEGVGRSGEWRSARLEQKAAELDATTAGDAMPEHVRLELHAPASIEGVVLDSDDRPVARAVVSVQPESGLLKALRPRTPQPVVTDADGRFSVLVGAPGGAGISAMREDGRELANAWIPLDEGEVVSIELRPTVDCVVTGVVVDEKEAPMADVSICCLGQPREEWVTTGSDGSFSLGIKGAGDFTIKATRAGFVQDSTVQGVLSVAHPKAGVTLRMLKAVTIAGRVVWDDGSPVERAMLDAVPIVLPGDARTPVRSWAAGWTGEDGSFTVRDVDPRFAHTVNVRAVAPALVKASVTGVEPGSLDVVLVLSRQEAAGRSIAGLVLDDSSGNPIAEFDLAYGKWTTSTSERVSTHISDSGGRFSVTGLNDFDNGLLVTAAGYPPAHFGPLTESDFTAGVVIRLGRLGSLTVTVVDEASQAVPDARLVAARAASLREPIEYTDHAYGRTGRDGRWHFADLVPGHYMLQADSPGRLSDVSFTQVPAEREGTATVTVRPTFERGTLVVHLQRSDGTPVGGAQVSVSSTNQLGLGNESGGEAAVDAESLQLTDRHGTTTFSSLLPGQYVVWPRPENDFIPPRSVVVRAGATTVTSFESRR